MIDDKEKFAASMINHWYVISRGMEIGRLRRHPRSKNYTRLKKIKQLEYDEARALFSTFASYTAKNFYANLQYVITNDNEISNLDGIKIDFGRITQRSGMLIKIIIDNSTQMPLFIKALNFSCQHPAVKNLLEVLPPFTIDEEGNSFKIIVPSARRSMITSFEYIEKEIERSINAIKSFLKLYQIISANITKDDQDSIYKENCVIKVINPIIDNGNISIGSAVLEETEESRNQRIMRQKLTDRLMKRTQRATQVTISPDLHTVTYVFDGQDHNSLVLKLDIITDW